MMRLYDEGDSLSDETITVSVYEYNYDEGDNLCDETMMKGMICVMRLMRLYDQGDDLCDETV